QEVAPAPIVVAARLGASREVRGGGHHLVVGAIAGRRVGFTPAHVENLLAGVSIGLTIGTISADDTGSVRKVIRHRVMARISITIPFSYQNHRPSFPAKIKPRRSLRDGSDQSCSGE